jgi:signal recognition particle subunit SEC65
MSVLDQFRDAERRVAERLRELEPAVAEYRELEDVARRLGLDVTKSQEAVAPSPPRQRRARRTTKPARKASRRARSVASVKANGAPDAAPRRTVAKGGGRGAQLLTLVQKRPGITVAEAGKELGVDPTGLYRVVKTLEQRGELRKNGRALEPSASRP